MPNAPTSGARGEFAMVNRLILCGGCGTKNRVPAGRHGTPQCGTCGKVLAVPGSKQGRGPFGITALTCLIVGGLLFGGYLWLNDQKTSSLAATEHVSEKPLRTSRPVQPASPVFDAPSIHASAGIMQRPSSPGVAPLGITTAVGNDYYVKLVDMADRPVMTIYVEGGRYFETEVPLGKFEMRYATGSTREKPNSLATVRMKSSSAL